MSRKSKLSIIEENLDQIREWKKIGVTDVQICRQLGIGKTTYYDHLKNNPNLSESINVAKEIFIIDLRNELVKMAKKHTLETKKQYIKKDLETGHATQYTEITTKEVDANMGAIHLLLKNLDRDNWSNDWIAVDLKKQELELRKKIAEDKLFT